MADPSKQLDGAVAVINGGNSGIGKATAMLFAKEGAAVVFVHHAHAKDAGKVVKAIVKAGGRAIAVAADVRKERDVQNVFDRAGNEFGVPTLLVNAAGVDAAGISVADTELDHFEMVLQTNFVGRSCSAARSCAG